MLSTAKPAKPKKAFVICYAANGSYTAAFGLRGSTESYEQTARRILKDQLGLTVKVKHGESFATVITPRSITRVYGIAVPVNQTLTIGDDPPHPMVEETLKWLGPLGAMNLYSEDRKRFRHYEVHITKY